MKNLRITKDISVPNMRGKVRRKAEIQIDYIDREGTPHQRLVRTLLPVHTIRDRSPSG